MKYQELLILLPCHSLEDFPTYHEGDEAEGLLSAWTSLWHPALLASSGTKPGWCRVDCPPTDLTNRLLVVPTVSTQQLPTGFAQRAKDEGACLVRRFHRRVDILGAALAEVDGGDGGVDPDLAADFLALGYTYLQVQLLTRQMRYSSNLDELHFQKQVVAGAVAALAHDTALAKEKLTACFDMLAEERNHYYPVEAFVLDLTLVAPTTLGASLRDEVSSTTATSLVLSGDTLAQLAEKEPESLAALREALATERVGLIGGEIQERRWPLLACESIASELTRATAHYQRLVGKRPVVWGRRRFGLTPALPGILQRSGFTGALHAALDDGRFPQGSQLKIRWEGADGSAIDAIARTPLDAAKPQTFVSYAIKMGESMDSDHVATILLAHWPRGGAVWLDDLRRAARYTAALGKFITVEQYFRETSGATHTDRFDASQYRSPYLKQAIIRRHVDPISSIVRYWQRRAQLEACRTLRALAVAVSGQATHGLAPTPATLEQWERQIDDAAEDATLDSDAAPLDTTLNDAVQQAAQQWANLLPRAATADEPGVLLVNPHNVGRRTGIELPASFTGLPVVEKPVVAADEQQGTRRAVIDVPPMGYTWLSSKSPARPVRAPRNIPMLAEETYLRNEFFEAIVNPVTGSLQSIHEYEVRGNRLSQQLAYRAPGDGGRAGETWQDPDETANYSVMAADEIKVTAASTTYGELTVRGRLLDQGGKPLAGFTEIFRVWRGSRVLGVELQLDPQVEPAADPWNSYFACRFAWADETSELFHTVNQTRHTVNGRKFEAPHYVDIVHGAKNTTILTGGLPFHRRVGHRMLDSLLIVRGERARRFRFGIGIDLTHPHHDAQSLLLPTLTLPLTTRPPAPSGSWLFHLDARNVQTTRWEPLVDGDRLVGVRVRLLEAAGRTARVKLSAFRPLVSARIVDFQRQPVADCALEAGAARIELAGHQWIEVEARWA